MSRCGTWQGVRSATVITVLALAGCASAPEPSEVDAGGRLLEDTPEIPFTVGVAPLDRTLAVPDGLAAQDPELKDGGRLKFALTESEVQAEIVRAMNAYRAAANVVAFNPDAHAADATTTEGEDAADGADATKRKIPTSHILEQARRAKLDLLVVPRVTVEAFLELDQRHWVGSTAAWLTTWYGGLVIKDRVYDARISVEFDIYSVPASATGDKDAFLVTIPASTTTDALSHKQRNSGRLSGDSAYTVIIPPAISPDNKGEVSRVLSVHIVEKLAGQLTRYLKDNLQLSHRARLGSVGLSAPATPRNLPLGKFEIVGTVGADEPIYAVQLLSGSKGTPILTMGGKDPKLPVGTDEEQATGLGGYTQGFRANLDAKSHGVLLLRVEFETIDERKYSRTFRLESPVPKPKPAPGSETSIADN